MLNNHLPSLEIARYELSLRAKVSVTLPPFLGSTLRGAFGHALKKTVCVAPHRDCERCMLVDRCIYPYLFETPVPSDVPQLQGQKNAPHPFILTPPFLDDSLHRIWRAPLQKSAGKQASVVATAGGTTGHIDTVVSGHRQKDSAAFINRAAFRCESEAVAVEKRHFKAGDTFRFGLTLLGQAIEQLPYVVYAVSEMARRGLGVNHAPFALVDVWSINQTGKRQLIYSSATQRFTALDSERYQLHELVNTRLRSLTDARQENLETTDSLTLRFVTPTRIRVQNNLQLDMSFELLVKNLLRRISMLIAVHGNDRMQVDFRGLIERAQSVKKVAERLHWNDRERYSNRQQTKIKLGGFVGEIDYQGEAIAEYLPLITAGELLHIGAGTGFGLGKYTIIK
jgi:hypothetical protein